ncbi:MAG: hypothetical protein ACFFBU_07565, partial [Promethearchaeota archaeon]
WTYIMTGKADFAAPIDVNISYAANITYTVTTGTATSFYVVQNVSGTVTWPSTPGEGEIIVYSIYLNMISTGPRIWDSVEYSGSNTTFGFDTHQGINLNNSWVPGGESLIVALRWTAGSSTLGIYVGMTWVYNEPYGMSIHLTTIPRPSFFLAQRSHTMVYWNTSYAPWGAVHPWFHRDDGFTGAPTNMATSEWASDSLVTPYGIRKALQNMTKISASGEPYFANEVADIEINTWIDADTGLLLRLTEDLNATNLWSGFLFRYSPSSWNQSTVVELVACNFFGLGGVFGWTNLGTLLRFLVSDIIIMVLILSFVILLFRRLKKQPSYG